MVAVSYGTQTVSASGANGSYTFAVTSGSLPAGLALNSSTGAITGTPDFLGRADVHDYRDRYERMHRQSVLYRYAGVSHDHGFAQWSEPPLY